MLKDRHPYKRLMFFNILLRFEREIRVFPALAQTSTKDHCGHNAEASVRRVCGWNEVEDTVSPCPPSEDLEDLERNEGTTVT